METVTARDYGCDEKAVLGSFSDPAHYDRLYQRNIRILKPDGSLLLVLLKRSISPTAGAALFHAVKHRIFRTDQRGTATGEDRFQRLKPDGTVSSVKRTLREVRSCIFGYYDRAPRWPYCRAARFMLDFPEASKECIPAIREADVLFRQHAPKPYSRQLRVAQQTHPDFLLADTTFTTVTLNKNLRTAYHKDAGDLPEGFGVISCFRGGKWTGGNLTFPRYRIAVGLDSCDLVLFDPHEIHGNTEIYPMQQTGKWYRITCVHYYRKNMRYCGSAAAELETAARHDPRRGSRNLGVVLNQGR